MAIIRASKTFEGGELTQRTSTYIKSTTRLVDFKNKENGVYLFLLGAYKQDHNGNGVWYRPLEVRDNFGVGMYKEKFAAQPNCPIKYFANKVQTFAPEMARSKETQDDSGRKRWVYPVWGRSAWRVLYNSALVGDYGAGVHVLDLPMSGGGSVIDEFVRGKDAEGKPNPDLTDYENAIPLNIKLDLKAAGQPWKILINQAKTYVLPVELADTDYLYNLDDVINYPKKDELIEKLRSIVPGDIFDRGMEGYHDDKVVVSMAVPKAKSKPVQTGKVETEEDAVPMDFDRNPVPKQTIPRVAPTVTIPKANKQSEDMPEAPQYTPPSSNSAALAAASAYFLSKKK